MFSNCSLSYYSRIVSQRESSPIRTRNRVDVIEGEEGRYLERPIMPFAGSILPPCPGPPPNRPLPKLPCAPNAAKKHVSGPQKRVDVYFQDNVPAIAPQSRSEDGASWVPNELSNPISTTDESIPVHTNDSPSTIPVQLSLRTKLCLPRDLKCRKDITYNENIDEILDLLSSHQEFRALCRRVVQKNLASRLKRDIRHLLKIYRASIQQPNETLLEKGVTFPQLLSYPGMKALRMNAKQVVKYILNRFSSVLSAEEEYGIPFSSYLNRSPERPLNLYGSFIEESSILELDHDKYKNVKDYMISCNAFDSFLKKFKELVKSPSGYRSARISNDWTSMAFENTNLQTFLFEVSLADPKGIAITTRSGSVENKAKSIIEEVTGESWDWWPLQNVEPTIPRSHARLSWRCPCGQQRGVVLPKSLAIEIFDIAQSVNGEIKPRDKSADIDRGFTNVKVSNGSGGSGGFPSHHSLAPMESPRSTSCPTKLEYPETMNESMTTRTPSFVFLGVNVGDTICIAPIDAAQHHTDTLFFESLKRQYYCSRGLLRSWFSIWRYNHCQFTKYEKFAENEISPIAGESYPDTVNDQFYIYRPKPMLIRPPISPHEFYRRFYACKPKKAWFHFAHSECTPCRQLTSYDALDRIPKRTYELDRDGADREIFWGIQAIEKPSFAIVVIYHIVALSMPFSFYFLWLLYLGSPNDLQGASVPFSMVIGMLSLLWFPLIHK